MRNNDFFGVMDIDLLTFENKAVEDVQEVGANCDFVALIVFIDEILVAAHRCSRYLQTFV